ncbi:unnamed protein product [Cochlearia groenlandica]
MMEAAATTRIPEKSCTTISATGRGTNRENGEKNGPGKVGFFRPFGPKCINQGPKSGLVGPFSALLSKSWYEETVEEEEKEKQAYLLTGEGPYSAPNGTTSFVSTGRDTQGNRLGIEEIISPLKDIFEVPIAIDPPKSRGKKVKKFNEALHAIKKFVNVSAKKGKMIKISRLTLKDYVAVSKSYRSKEGPNKRKGIKGKEALVGRVPPANE